MKKFSIWGFMHALEGLAYMMRTGKETIEECGTDSKPDEAHRDSLVRLLGELKSICTDLGLDALTMRIELFDNLFSGIDAEGIASDPNWSMVKAELDGLHNTLYNEFIGLRFFLVSPENTRTFEREKIFGEAVFNSFPSARKDAELSGTCLALGLADAAIFHLMRVTEIGLRALAKHLRVKDRVVEHATWGRIIGAMEIKKEELRKKSKSKKQNELLEFYSGILAELNGFKDVWRNNIMHTQKSYDIPEAQKVLMRVQDFVQRLAGRIKEK